LEWATSCPPPRHNFRSLPRIRSERPAFDLHYPQFAGQIDYHASPEVELGAGTGPGAGGGGGQQQSPSDPR
jgi:cytochrome c oxidase subunit I